MLCDFCVMKLLSSDAMDRMFGRLAKALGRVTGTNKDQPNNQCSKLNPDQDISNFRTTDAIKSKWLTNGSHILVDNQVDCTSIKEVILSIQVRCVMMQLCSMKIVRQ